MHYAQPVAPRPVLASGFQTSLNIAIIRTVSFLKHKIITSNQTFPPTTPPRELLTEAFGSSGLRRAAARNEQVENAFSEVRV